MSQKEQLLKYFKNLDSTEQLIVLGTAAKLYREKMLVTTELVVPAYKATKEEISSAMNFIGNVEHNAAGRNAYSPICKRSERAD